MISPSPKFIYVIVFLFAIFSQFSCSKDSDLLAEYTSVDTQKALVEIKVLAVINEPVVIDIANAGENTIVTEITDPTIGTASVNPDNSITYTPNPDTTGTDEFSYTTETTIPNEPVTTSTGNVKVAISTAVAMWQAKFDKQFEEVDGARMLVLAKSGNKFQDYYYMYFYLDGLLSIWQATGDNKYLDTILQVINLTITDAKPVSFNSKYLGWQADSSYSLDYDINGVALWESYYWKVVTTLLRMMKQSPNLMATGNYQMEFNDILVFTKEHIWNKWEAKGVNNIYRSETHMASHWARMGMELFIITGEQKYKKVFDNISFGVMPGWPSNLRDRLRPNPKVPSAYVWDKQWNVAPGGKIQDTAHASDIVGFWILAYENKMYWTKADIDALSVTLDKTIFPTKDAPNCNINVDGSGGYDNWGMLRDWVKLGRYNRSLQNRLINEFQSEIKNARRYATQMLGNYALNEKILADGVPVYPENP